MTSYTQANVHLGFPILPLLLYLLLFIFCFAMPFLGLTTVLACYYYPLYYQTVQETLDITYTFK